jgi:hypothetical protein
MLLNLASIIENLENGFNVALFLFKVNIRFEPSDLQEFELLATLLGKAISKNVYIVITHMDRLSLNSKEICKHELTRKLPGYLKENGWSGLEDKILLQIIQTSGSKRNSKKSY